MLVVQSMRQSHRLAVSWDMVFDPATLMFLVGGLAWITIDAGRLNSIRLRWAEWGWTMARFALDRGRLAADPRGRAPGPLSSSRESVSEWNQPLHVMNQFLSPWVLLAMLVPPILLAWRWVPLLGDAPLPAAEQRRKKPGRTRRSSRCRSSGPSSWQVGQVADLPDHGRLAIRRVAFGQVSGRGRLLLVRHDSRCPRLQWEPIGARKAGRVMIVEKHSPWSPSNPPYNTEFLGGGVDEHGSSYNYAAAYQYLSQYYEMSRLNEEDAIDEKTLSACDVLVIKIPRVRFTPEEVQAVVNFVEAGGGLLLIGDHTNLERSAAHMNDITRAFGFTFRDDVLYSTQPSPDQEHYRRRWRRIRRSSTCRSSISPSPARSIRASARGVRWWRRRACGACRAISISTTSCPRPCTCRRCASARSSRPGPRTAAEGA